MTDNANDHEYVLYPDAEGTGVIVGAIPLRLPDDTIRTTTGDLTVILDDAPENPRATIGLGLYLELAPPIGPVRVRLTAGQAAILHDKLSTLLGLEAEKVSAIAAELSGHHDG